MFKQLANSLQSIGGRLGHAPEAVDPDRKVIFIAMMLGVPFGAILGAGGDDAVAVSAPDAIVAPEQAAPPITAALRDGEHLIG